MSVLAAAAIVLLAVAGAVGVMLGLRATRAPEGGWFSDSDRAAGVFGVLGTGFAVVLGFVVFLAFESYGGAKEAAENEAVAVIEMFESSRLFDATDRDTVEADLVCYARAVIHDEWDRMEDSERSPSVEDWIRQIQRHSERVRVKDEKAAAAYALLLDQTSERERARSARLLEARHVLPPLLWFMLLMGGGIVIAYMFLFADPREGRPAQVMLVASVTAVVVTSLLLVSFLNAPYGDQGGDIRPVAMEHSLDLMEDELEPGVRPDCDSDGRPG